MTSEVEKSECRIHYDEVRISAFIEKAKTSFVPRELLEAFIRIEGIKDEDTSWKNAEISERVFGEDFNNQALNTYAVAYGRAVSAVKVWFVEDKRLAVSETSLGIQDRQKIMFEREKLEQQIGRIVNKFLLYRESIKHTSGLKGLWYDFLYGSSTIREEDLNEIEAKIERYCEVPQHRGRIVLIARS